MSRKSLSIRVAGLELRNPTALASGILGYSAESLQRIAEAAVIGVGLLVYFKKRNR